jgi:hypothetical protein
MDPVAKGNELLSKVRLNSDETSLSSEIQPMEDLENSCEMDDMDENSTSNRINSYEDDTEEYLDSDSDLDSVMDDLPHGKSKDDKFVEKECSGDDDSVCSEASDCIKGLKDKCKSVISIMDVSQSKRNTSNSVELDISDIVIEVKNVDSDKQENQTISKDVCKEAGTVEVDQDKKDGSNSSSFSSINGDTKLLNNGILSDKSKSADQMLTNPSSTNPETAPKDTTSSQEGSTNTPATLAPSISDSTTSKDSQSLVLPSVPPGLPVNLKGEPLHGLFRCNVCAEVFDSAILLKHHLSNHPEATDGRKTFACEKCDMKFAHKQNLMRHQAVHTGMYMSVTKVG